MDNPTLKAVRIRAAKRAIKKAGGVAKLVNKINAEQGLNLEPSSVYQWKTRGVAAYYVIPVERATGISRHDLNPRLYPIEVEVMPPSEETIMLQMPPQQDGAAQEAAPE